MTKNLNFYVIDFETANTFANSACSVGFVRFINGKETGSVYSLIHPAKMYFFLCRGIKDAQFVGGYSPIVNKKLTPEDEEIYGRKMHR